jgi:hypothetical protein
MRRALLLFVVAGALTLSASLTAFPQEAGEPQQGAAQYEPEAGEAQYEPEAGEAQYPQEETATTETGCSWQWGYRWNSAGGWEWWCYDPKLGWYYGENEDGSGKVLRAKGPGSFMMQT